MKLIEFKNNELVISDEAFHIKCFRDMYERNADEAMTIFGYLYFMFHPGSDYNYITDWDEKIETVSEALGIEDINEFLDFPEYKQCVDIYQKMVITSSSKLIDGNRRRMDKLNTFLDELVLDDDNMAKFTKAISDSNKLAVELSIAEKEIFKDIEEQSAKVRGKTQLTIGDLGLSNV